MKNKLLKKILVVAMTISMACCSVVGCGEFDDDYNSDTVDDDASDSNNTSENPADGIKIPDVSFDFNELSDLSSALDYAVCYNMEIPEDGNVPDDFWDKMVSAFICNSWYSPNLDNYGQELSVDDLEEIASVLVNRQVSCGVYAEDYTVNRSDAASPYLNACEKKITSVKPLGTDTLEIEFDYSYSCCSLTVEDGLKHVVTVLQKNEASFLNGYSIIKLEVDNISEPVDAI